MKLLWPTVPALFLVAVASLAEWNGHQWNIHGEGVLFLGLLFVSIAVGTVASIFALCTLVPLLRRHPTLRSRTNLACAGLSALFVAVTLSWIAFGLAAVALQ
jgi:hypothetical protein